ncbi:MAG: isoprenylcysteine carboxylmethyltransferase family protein [Deinococcota bacterium]
MITSARSGDARGEGLVAAQLLLLAGIAVLPLLRPAPQLPPALRRFGTLCMVAGGGLALWSGQSLGHNLTPLPEPKTDGALIQSGPYALARHPLYGGLLLASVGWALQRGHREALELSVLLAGLLEIKTREEERRLTRRFPGYPAYRRRVRKLIPGVY